MGIYAPNVDIPKNCCVCGFSRTANYRKKDIENGFRAIGGRMCSITGNVMPMYCSYRTKMRECPLVPVPPHGRLIDADALTSVLETLKGKSGNPVIWDQMTDIVKDIHTVIDAEDGDLA